MNRREFLKWLGIGVPTIVLVHPEIKEPDKVEASTNSSHSILDGKQVLWAQLDSRHEYVKALGFYKDESV